MDKWEDMVSRVKNGILAEEPEAALSGALEMFAEFGRTVQQIGFNIDRIATALENGYSDEDAGIPPELQHDEPAVEHDL
jgi:hypothetical protein